MSSEASAGWGESIETDVPARLDRLPWSKFHWMVIVGLGTVFGQLTARLGRKKLFGPGLSSTSRSIPVGGPYPPVPLDREVALIGAAPRAAIASGRVKSLPRGRFAPVEPPEEDR